MEFRRVWAGKRRLRKGILGQPPRAILSFFKCIMMISILMFLIQRGILIKFRFFSFRTLLSGDVELFDFLPCPRCLSQEFKAGLHGGIAGETTDFYVLGQFVPAVIGNENVHDLFQSYSVQRVFVLLFVHTSKFKMSL